MNIDTLVRRARDTARNKGWRSDDLADRHPALDLMLVVTELSEAMEELRAGHGTAERDRADRTRLDDLRARRQDAEVVRLRSAIALIKVLGLEIGGYGGDAVIRACEAALYFEPAPAPPGVLD